MTDSENVLA